MAKAVGNSYSLHPRQARLSSTLRGGMRDSCFETRLGETRTLGRVGRSEENGSRPATVLMISTTASGSGKARWRIGVSPARSAGHPRQVCASGFREGGFAAASRQGSLFVYVTLSVRRGRTRRGLGAANPPQAIRSAPTQRSNRD